MMSMVEFGKVWNINTIEEYEHAMKVLDDNEFCADMSDDWWRAGQEKAEIRRQRRAVLEQAAKFNA